MCGTFVGCWEAVKAVFPENRIPKVSHEEQKVPTNEKEEGTF